MFLLSLLFGTLTCLAVWHFCSVTTWLTPSNASTGGLVINGDRMLKLRQLSSTYRWFGALADEIGHMSFVRTFAGEKSVSLSLSRGAIAAPFTPSEFIGTKAVEGMLAGVALGMMWNAMGWGAASTFAIVVVMPFAYLVWSVYDLSRRARRRMLVLASRLPFAIDSLSLMLDAGANIDEALATVSDAAPDHPVSQEFSKVLHEMQRGITFRAAVERMDRRLQLPAIQEFSAATLIAHDLGTPLKSILSQLAEQMRMRRAQDIESAAGRAQVQLVQPATLMLVAAMVMVVAPFLLPVLSALTKLQ